MARKRWVCWKCGYDRAGLPPGACCPECNASPTPPLPLSYRLPLPELSPLAKGVLLVLSPIVFCCISGYILEFVEYLADG